MKNVKCKIGDKTITISLTDAIQLVKDLPNNIRIAKQELIDLKISELTPSGIVEVTEPFEIIRRSVGMNSLQLTSVFEVRVGYKFKILNINRKTIRIHDYQGYAKNNFSMKMSDMNKIKPVNE